MARSLSVKMPNTLGSLATLFDTLQRALSAFCTNSAGLTIGSSSKPKIKIANTIYCYIEGVLKSKTTAELTLTTAHNVANAKFNVLVVSMNAAGTTTVTAGTEASTLAGVLFPALPDGDAMIGYVIINPTGTGGFVGGTTDLDDATVIPGAVYVNTPYPFLPGLAAM